MTPSTKAALTSALLFPGLGQITVLKRVARGCIFLLPAAAALLFLLGDALRLANTLAEQIASGALPLNPQVIADKIAAANDGPGGTIAATVLLVAWIASVIDALVSRN